jgi:hypothetical protein
MVEPLERNVFGDMRAADRALNGAEQNSVPRNGTFFLGLFRAVPCRSVPFFENFVPFRSVPFLKFELFRACSAEQFRTFRKKR